MTLRRRLALAFAVVLALFALNLLVHLWTHRLEHDRLVALEHAETRELLVATLGEQLDDRETDVELLTAAFPDPGAAQGVGRPEWALFEGKLADLDRVLGELAERTPEARKPAVALLATEVGRLRQAWLDRENGADEDVLARRHADELLAGLAADERMAIDQAARDAGDLARTTSRATVAFLLLSALVAAGVALGTSRLVHQRLGDLAAGAERVGRGDLGRPIPVPARDELGLLAEAFNDMASRLAALRETEARLRQEEKMASLGKVAAGLAHELNNPAAALDRNVATLAAHLDALEDHAAALTAQGVPAARVVALADYRRELAAGPRAGHPDLGLRDPLVRADREAEMEAWLAGMGVDEAWELAPDLVRAGAESGRLEALLGGLAPAARAQALAWWGRTMASSALLAESAVGTRRMSEIVGAVGRYSHLGEAQVGDVDVVAGLEDTLTVLRSRLSGVRLESDLAADLPPVEGHAGELNQVWTILIDNALDAMEGSGTLTLTARRRDGDGVAVEVRDDGPGIPEDLQRSLFDPFFTTKPVGAGTGLGLHIARQLVARHGGEIEVESTPGEGACFRVLLPAAR